MGHATAKGYRDLQARLDAHAQGAPESPALYRILEVLFSEEEAELTSRLPMRFFTAEDAAARWRMDIARATTVLDGLADKGILLDVARGETRAYILAPTMAGFFEFSLMRLDGRFDRALLSELFYDYINQEESFVEEIFGLDVPIDRVFAQEEMMEPQDHSLILHYERTSHIIESASAISVGCCYCRHKMEHKGLACRAPQDVCLTFNTAAESLIRHGIARQIEKQEALRIIERSIKRGLVQIGDNVQNNVNWICNCCGCCCEAILAYKRLGYTSRIHSNYLAQTSEGACEGCGACIHRCPVDAISERDVGEGEAPNVEIDAQRCFGCGVCVRACQPANLRLARRDETNHVPADSFERYVVNAIDAGKLQNYIFDNQDLWTHRALRKLLGTILTLPAIRRATASRQLQSRFVWALSKTRLYELFDRIYNEGRDASQKGHGVNA